MNIFTDDKDLEWKELSKKPLLKTPIATINESLCSSSQGIKNNYIIIDSKDWVVVVPVKNDNFIMVKQWRHGEKALSIEFPGGVIENNETPEQGARRELLEETSFTAGKMIYLGKMNPNPAFMGNHVHFFAAMDLEESGNQHLDEDEYLNYFEMPQKIVWEKMGTSEMPHALMAAALLFYSRFNEKTQSTDSAKNIKPAD